MKKLIYLSALLLWSIYFVSCKSETTEFAEKQKSNVLKSDTISNATKKSDFYIAPPDVDYTGDYVDKYPNGVIKFTGFFRFGKRHGQWLAFYDNGVKWSECFYDNGKKHGQTTVYFPNGNTQMSGWYKNDLQDSLWYFYDINKREIDRRAFRNGVETGLVN